MPFPSRNLTNQYISLSYQDVVQRYNPAGTASYLLDGLGNELLVFDNGVAGQKILTVNSTASYAIFAGNVVTASYAIFAGNVVTASYAISSSHSILSTLAQVADVALIADTASVAISASYAPSAPSVSASYALTASFALNGGGSSLTTGSTYPITASWSNNTVSSSTALHSNISDAISFVPQVALSASWASSSISASYANIASSLQGTASYSVTASYAQFSVSSSYVNGLSFNNTSSIIQVSQSNVVVSEQNTGSYTSVFIDYAISSGSNSRAGSMIGNWNGTSFQFTEYSTIDIGNTSLVTMSLALSTSFIQLLTNVPTNIWNVKSMGRYL